AKPKPSRAKKASVAPAVETVAVEVVEQAKAKPKPSRAKKASIAPAVETVAVEVVGQPALDAITITEAEETEVRQSS
ncbi:MAG: hypothetical protein WCD69_25565, partial [Xanthobacteraceae bacterium]